MRMLIVFFMGSPFKSVTVYDSCDSFLRPPPPLKKPSQPSFAVTNFVQFNLTLIAAPFTAPIRDFVLVQKSARVDVQLFGYRIGRNIDRKNRH